MSKLHDVAVVGLGPVGAVPAGLLGRAGIRTLVIDKADDIYPLPRAIAFGHEVMRVLQGLGPAEAMPPWCARIATSWQWRGSRLIWRHWRLSSASASCAAPTEADRQADHPTRVPSISAGSTPFDLPH
jgi:2-polyprenyl-6-methoxyphenol hydroxylase-like FAD-dependent oxidoreductase